MANLQLLSFVLVVVWSVGHPSVNIQASAQQCVDGDVRLMGGSHYREGRVEVCRHQQWGRVCDDEWDENDSTVVCRQLGLSNEGVMAITGDENLFNEDSTLPFVLDDLGCSGSERNLLDCLPRHNCRSSSTNENAGVRCLRKGVTLEYGPQRLNNNSLITLNDLGEGNRALFCATDRGACCTDEYDNDGNWFMPSGSKIEQQFANGTQELYISRANQTVGLNYVNVSDYDVPSGIYHCEITDDNNVISRFYVGIYPQNEGTTTITSLDYDSGTHTLVCTSIGGPATTVVWSKDNSSRINDDQYYEHSVVIVSRASATYESRLRILNKSSTATGNYTCMVSNSRGSSQGSIYLQVCRDMELRFNDGDTKNVEVCSSDQWHAVSNSAILNNSTLGNITVTANPTSAMIGFSLNDLRDDQRVRRYDVSCTTISNGQIHSVKVADVSREITTTQMTGLTPNTDYECCVMAYIETNIPIDIISLSCTTVRTLSLTPPIPEAAELNNNFYIIGFWTSLSICLLVLCVCVLSMILFLCALKQQNKALKYSSGSTEKDYIEHMVVNPLYTNSGSIQESGEFRDRNLSVVAANPQYGTRAEVVHVQATYETISEFPTRPKDTQRSYNGQPGAEEPNAANGLGNNSASQLDSANSKTDTATPQLYSTIPESYKKLELSSTL